MPSPPLSIVQSLSPRIAVLTSDDVVTSCEANGCRGLEELLRPWEGATDRVSILSSTLTPTIHPTFPLRFVSYDSIFTNPAASSPDPEMVVDMIGTSVGSKQPDEELHYPLTRSLLLSSRPLAPHETFNHPVGIMYAVSTSTPDPLGTLGKLHAQTMGAMGTSTPWLDGVTVMKLFVVVHDVSRMGEDLGPRAKELLGNVKKAHGPHSTMLVINSQVEQRGPPPSPDVSTHPSIPLPRPFSPEDVTSTGISQVYASALSSLSLSPMSAASSLVADGQAVSDTPSSPSQSARRKMYGQKLSAEDTQRLAALVRELVVQSLVPWMEARIREWNEVYSHNRRGITGRLFGAGRKLFGSRPNSPAPNAAQAGYNAVKGYYPTFAIEALSRRLADFAFMLRDYKFASAVYDSLRRDFAQDRAWRYAAAATEMYGFSTLLAHTYFLPSSPPAKVINPFTTLQHMDISSWLEQAVLAYHSRAPANQIQLDALRISVLYYEAWKTIGEWRGVGTALVKGAGEADEVPSAVLIEEAATADVKGGKSEKGGRRRAHHLVMAARRYETAGLKAYSRRCLDRASQLYRSTPWTAAQDRIEYSLGRQAYTLGESDVAVEHFLRLLRREDTGTPGSQNMILEDMALAYEQLAAHPEMLKAAKDKLELPTPVFDVSKTRVVTTSNEASGSGTSGDWDKIEEMALGTWDRKGKKPLRLLPDDKRLSASVESPFYVELSATNPLNAPLILSQVRITTDGTDDLGTESLEEMTLEPYETRIISLPLKIDNPSTVTIHSVKFNFHRFFPCEQLLNRRGRRLHATKEQRLTPTYATDTSLTVHIEPARPVISARVEGMPDHIYVGEEVGGTIEVRNEGKMVFENVQIFLNPRGCVRIAGDATDGSSHIPNRMSKPRSLDLHTGAIPPGESRSIPIVLSLSRPGQVDLSGILIASSTDSPDDAAVTTIAHTLECRPLCSVSVKTQYSRSRLGDHLITAEVTNEATEALQIDQLCLLSQFWTFSDGKFDAALLPPNQSYRAVLSVTPNLSAELDLRQSRLVTNLGKLVDNQADEIKPFEAEAIDLSTIGKASKAYLSSADLHRNETLSLQFPTITPDIARSIFPLVNPLDLDLVVSWSIPGTPRSGHFFSHGIRAGPEFSIVEDLRHRVESALLGGGKQTRTMYEETGRLRKVLLDSVLDGVLAQEDDPLVVRGFVENAKAGVASCDFSQGPCHVPVSLQVHNLSSLIPARYILRLPSQPSPSKIRDSPYAPARHVGALEHRGTLKPGATNTISSLIWVEEPALVELGWELEVETGEETGDEDTWKVRKTWNRRERGGVWKIEQRETVE